MIHLLAEVADVDIAVDRLVEDRLAGGSETKAREGALSGELEASGSLSLREGLGDTSGLNSRRAQA